MTYPDVPLGYLIEVAPGADTSTDPATWPWTDITADLVANMPIKHKIGSDDEQGEGSSESSLMLRNPTRRWSTDNPLSDMWPGWAVDCPIRCSLSLDGSSTWTELWTQFAAEIIDTWGGTSGKLPRTTVRAGGVFRRLGTGDALKSALHRTMSGVAVGDFVPWAYWPMEDGEDTTWFASATPGVAPMTLGGDITPATSDAIIGSQPLPVWQAGSNATGTVPAYTDTGAWSAQATLLVPDDLVNAVTVFRATMSGGTYGSVSVGITGVSGELGLVTRDTSDVVVDTWLVAYPAGTVLGQPVSVSVKVTDDASGTDDGWEASLIAADGTILASISELSGAGHYGQITGIIPNGALALASDVVIGHAGVWVDPAFTLGTDDVSNARAINGWNGEMAHERIARILRELGIASDVTATRSTVLGPQRPGRALDVLRDAERADHGILDDSRGAVAYRALSEMYGQTPALVIDADEYELGFPLRSITDDQKLVNRSTVTRIGGSSATVDRSNGAAVRLGDDPELNLYDDTQPVHHASWYVNLGTVKGKRVPQISINFRAAPQLAAAFLALRLGDRVQVVNAPQELSNTGILDMIWVGWAPATRSRTVFTATANCVPYAPYDVAIYGSTAGTTTARYGARNSVLDAGIDANDTAVVIDSGGDVWATTASHPAAFPLNVTLGGPGGLVYSCTAITGTGPYTFTLVRLATDRAWAAGTPVQVTDVARYGL